MIQQYKSSTHVESITETMKENTYAYKIIADVTRQSKSSAHFTKDMYLESKHVVLK